MVSSRSWKNSNFNRMMCLALCVGVAFLLLAGSAFAQTAGVTSITAANATSYATQATKVAQVYTIPASPVGDVERLMGVPRVSGVGGAFLLYVTLPSPFTFSTAVTGTAANVTLKPLFTGGAVGFTCGAAPFSGGTVGANFVNYQCQFATTAPTTAPTILISTGGWLIKDGTTVNTLGTAGTNLKIKVQTFDANSGLEFDNGSGSVAETANPWLKSANGITASITPTKAVIDVSTTSLRKLFVAGALGGTDATNQDNDASVTINLIPALYGNTGALYVIAAGDTVTLTLSSNAGNLNGVTQFIWSPGTGNQVIDAVTTTPSGGEQAANSTILTIPSTNLALPAAGASVTVPLRIVVDGTTVLTTRTLNVVVANVISGQTVVPPNSTLVASTTLSDWGINGSVLMSNWSNANAAAWKSRFYIFNETSAGNAQVIVRMFQIPISSNATAPTAQIGSTVVLSKLLGAVSGMTIRLEDIITASGAVSADLAGPDGSYNVAVEITVYAPSTSGFVTGGVTGFAQTFNLAGTVFTGTSPLSKIQ